MESLFKYKCYEIGYAELSEKMTFFKKYLPLKRFQFSEKVAVQIKHRFEKVYTLNNYLFWRKSSPETVAVLKKYLSSRSS